MGVCFDNQTKAEFVRQAGAMLDEGRKGYCVTPNAEIVYEAIHDPEFRDLLNGASMVLPDGAGVILGAKILGTPMKRSGRLFLLGAKPGVAEQAGQNLTGKYPGLVICGTADGYFKDEDAVVEQIRRTKPDVVFVCLGAPKQERFIRNHIDELDVTLMLGLGGSLDGYAGIAQRAPKWMIDLSLEWLYRLIKDPKRLGRMMRLPKFVGICLKEKRRRKKNG